MFLYFALTSAKRNGKNFVHRGSALLSEYSMLLTVGNLSSLSPPFSAYPVFPEYCIEETSVAKIIVIGRDGEPELEKQVDKCRKKRKTKTRTH